MKRILLTLVVTLSAAAITPDVAGAAQHRLGGGLHYFRTLDNLEGFDLDEDGAAWVASYQYVPAGLVRFEIDLEYYADGFGGTSGTAFAPIGYIVVGKGLYGALGLGFVQASEFSDNVSDPFYAARAGFELTLLPRVHIDLNLNYRFGAFDELGSAATDVITLGALARLSL